MIEFFIRRPKIVNLMMIFLFLAGAIGMRLVQTQGYPAVDFGIVNITTVYPGASPEDVEYKVTTKIEDALDGIGGIKTMTSMSIEGVSQIQIGLEDNADYDKVKQDIRAAVDTVQDFPPAVNNRPEMSEVNNDRIPVVELSLRGTVSEHELRRYASALENQLKTSSLVSTISKLGYREREVHINADLGQLDRYYVSLSQLVHAIHVRNIQESAGDIDDGFVSKKLQLTEEFDHPIDVKDVIIRSGFDGNRVRVSDVATVKESFKSSEKLYRFNGKSGINFIIFKKETADILKASHSIKTIVHAFKAQLPDSIQLAYIIDYSNDARRLLDLVKTNALLGLVLVLVTLVLFFNTRMAFWTAMGIPTAIFFAFLIFPLVGVTINFISLMGIIIVLGMVVDDAIIVAENIYRYKEQGMDGVEAAIKGTKEVLWPVVTTVITTLIAFAPLIVMTGVMGKFMWAMPVVVSLVLVGSLIECLFVLPSHIAHSKMSVSSNRLQLWRHIMAGYRRLVIKTLNYPIITFMMFIIMFMASIGLLIHKLEFALFDTGDGMYSYVKYELPVGTPLAVTSEKTKEIEAIISQMSSKEVAAYVTTIGEKMPPIASYGQDTDHGSVGNIVIHLTDMSHRHRKGAEIMRELHQRLQHLDGFDRIDAAMIPEGPPIGREITVIVISNDDDARQQVSQQIKDFLVSIPSVYNLEDNQGRGKNKLEVRLDHELVSQLGLTTQQIAQTLSTAYEGTLVTSIRRQGEEINYRVQLDSIYQADLAFLKQIKLLNNQDQLIQLGQVIQITETSDALQQMHYDGDRAIIIYGDIDETHTGTALTTPLKVNAALLKKFKPIIAQYPGMRLEMGGEEKDTQEAMKSLVMAMGLALIGIYFILVLLFDSFSQPFLVMIAIPFTFSGIILTFYLHHMVFGFMAILGLIGLTGIIVNDSLILISMMNAKVKVQGWSIEVIADAALSRFRPIMLTTLTTAAGLLPTAYGFGGENPFLVPMIMAIAWGRIFATIITLILIPSIYWLQYRFSCHIRKSIRQNSGRSIFK